MSLPVYLFSLQYLLNLLWNHVFRWILNPLVTVKTWLILRRFVHLKTGANVFIRAKQLKDRSKWFVFKIQLTASANNFLCVCLHKYADYILITKPHKFMDEGSKNVNIYHMENKFLNLKLKCNCSFCTLFCTAFKNICCRCCHKLAIHTISEDGILCVHLHI